MSAITISDLHGAIDSVKQRCKKEETKLEVLSQLGWHSHAKNQRQGDGEAWNIYQSNTNDATNQPISGWKC